MFQFKTICFLALGALSISAHAKLVEDGSSFTGIYDIVEPTCYRPSASTAKSAKVLSRVRFLGTPAGIYPNLAFIPGTAHPYDGLLIPVSEPHTNDHGSGIFTSAYAKYLSEQKFISFSKVERPEYTRSWLNEISITPNNGLLTWTASQFEGSNKTPSEVTACHYRRTGVLPP